MKHIIIIQILLSCNWTLYSQQIEVLSETDGTAVAYANIVYLAQNEVVGGAYTDSSGRARLSFNHEVDRVRISHMQYISRSIDVENLGELIYLHPDYEHLDEVVVHPRNELETSYIGAKNTLRSAGLSANPGIEIVSLVENDVAEDRWIKSFVFYIKRRNKDYTPIVKIVFYHNEEGKPGRKISREIVETIDANAKGKIEIDVEDSWITVPRHGIFAGIEWIGCIEHADIAIDSTDTYCSRTIKASLNEDVSRSYVRNRFSSEKWDELEAASDHYLTPIFGLEIYR